MFLLIKNQFFCSRLSNPEQIADIIQNCTLHETAEQIHNTWNGFSIICNIVSFHKGLKSLKNRWKSKSKKRFIVGACSWPSNVTIILLTEVAVRRAICLWNKFVLMKVIWYRNGLRYIIIFSINTVRSSASSIALFGWRRVDLEFQFNRCA